MTYIPKQTFGVFFMKIIAPCVLDSDIFLSFKISKYKPAYFKNLALTIFQHYT